MSHKGLIIQQREYPSVPGFLDTLIVSANDHILWAAPCRSGPNWRTPWRKGGEPWQLHYDWIAPTPANETLDYDVMVHPRYGKCVRLNWGGEVPSRNPVVNRDGTIFRGVFIHRAYTTPWNNLWPGSAGCVTLRKVHWRSFQAMLSVGERGKLVVEDCIKRLRVH